ncbi:MAG: flavodoxin family protein [Candidatus Solibacter usitatus]|nr:flavodoxin family protein [Candidatus Solibacter usitatus]
MTQVLLAAVFSLAAAAQQPPVRVLVAYHSGTGNTEKLAQSVRDGASAVQGVEVTLRKVSDFKYDEITGYDGVVLGTPVHWSGVSVEAKRFLDGIGAALWKAKATGDGRTAGVFCTAGHPSMGKDTVRLSVLSAFLTMRFVVVGGVESEGYGTLGPEATTGSTDPGISEKELTEARRFGERFARTTRQLRLSR